MTQVHPSRRSRLAVIGSAGVLALAGSVVAALPAGAAGGNGCENRNNDTVAKLTECVTVDGVTEHLEALQGIADDNGGTRVSGSPGYDASVDYVAEQLEGAGYTVTRQPFEFPFFEQTSPSVFSRVSPDPLTFVEGTDYAVATYSGTGDVTGVVQAVDVVIPPSPAANGNTSGCEDADFATFTAGNIALLQRGTCTFGEKVANAVEAGAAGVVLFNEGQPGREDLLSPTLGAPIEGAVPVVGVSHQAGVDLQGDTVRLAVTTVSELRDTENVIAELPGRTTDNVVMAGAHLDSVAAGPGINDNGSGSAAILEVAQDVAETKPQNTIRFAWWGAEEYGLLGSNHYVSQLDEQQVADIGLYLNFDMVGSPNFARFIYDGDQSAFTAPVVVPEGSDQIEYVFEDYYEQRQLPYEATEFSGRSDYQAFILAGIPSGGLFTGAEGIKTPEQAADYGGTAGTAYDPNYHQAGDTIGNVDRDALDQNSDAIAYAVLTLAYDTARVNGVTGQPVPGGTFEGDPDARQYRQPSGMEVGGGGLSPDHGHDHDHGHGGDAV
ncbi:Zn-dependent M28 family amino/carboxypeptidase [Geodermatophilus bullaregiensis]|uniref:M28 family metallopeptidase n=1 Tax=Geodermatophilus bullaregiensis TaxID=1564160 RepID=UPI00195C2948|nr:M28 family metallopeptidase [Geodermatophilus bullaregiensis]MBM7807399.1 Zn-dependent M28 family amino/carboxypeptidase [Geodermatophilus bullaregiensis]